MKAIPLLKPHHPHPHPGSTWYKDWAAAAAACNTYSNFGPQFYRAATALERFVGPGWLAIPCASGDVAVRTLVAVVQETYGSTIGYEYFTFQSTRTACRKYDELRTGSIPWGSHKAVVRTHSYGRSRIFKQEGLVDLIIDACGAFGPDFLSRYPASAYIAVSFHATKNFPIGEGGAMFIPIKDIKTYERCVRKINFGFTPGTQVFSDVHGYNGKLDEMHCALLVEQIENNACYFSTRAAYNCALSEQYAGRIRGAHLPYTPGQQTQSLAVIAHEDPAALTAKLAAADIATRRIFWPWEQRYEDYLAEDEKGLIALPCDVTQEEIEHVINAANAWA